MQQDASKLLVCNS